MVKFKTVSIIIPVFNEKRTIADVLHLVMSVPLMGLSREIIIINDGSTDGTEKELLKLKEKYKDIRVFYKKNGGKGSALRLGIQKARGQIIIPQDADLELSPKDFEKLITPIINNESKVVFGYRNWSKVKIPFHSKIANFIVTFLANFLYRAKIRDEACGYKIMTRTIYKSLNLQSNGFEICPEILSKVRKLGYSICSVPVQFKPRKFNDGKKINFGDGFRAIWLLVKFRFFV